MLLLSSWMLFGAAYLFADQHINCHLLRAFIKDCVITLYVCGYIIDILIVKSILRYEGFVRKVFGTDSVFNLALSSLKHFLQIREN